MGVRFCREVGCDYVFMVTGFSLPKSFKTATDSAVAENWPDGQRHWADERGGPIQTWADFECDPWPKPEDLQHAGLESFSYALRDQPDLIEANCERVGELATATCSQVTTIDNVEIVFLSDDLGFYSGTLVSPAVIRCYILPH